MNPSLRRVLLRILVVEDNILSAESMADLLRLDGHTVEIASDGSSALEVCRRFQPHVVLLDIGLPDMDGYDVARQIRVLDLNVALIIALTGYSSEEDQRRSREAGCDHHLTKPVPFNKLLSIINALSSAAQ